MGHCFPKNVKDDEDSDRHIEFAGKNVHLNTTTKSWDQRHSESIGDGKIVIANFSASWCDPCQTMAPFYIELSEKHRSIMFLLIDVDELTGSRKSWPLIWKILFECCSLPHTDYALTTFLNPRNSATCLRLMQEFSTSWDLKATPTFFFLRNGQQFNRLVGTNKPVLQKKIAAILVEPTPSSQS